MKSFDVAILGGGPAGSATALSLLAQGLDPSRLLVVEASSFERERIGESIPPDTRRLFDALGVLSAFMAESHEPCHGSASSWGADELGYNDFLLNPYGSGWHLDRRRFDAWLCAEVEARGVIVCKGRRFLDVADHTPDGATLALRLSAGITGRIRTRFVVDATGRRALYAKRMGAGRRQLDLLVTAACFFRLPASCRFAKLTFLEAVEHGYWYTARLPEQRIATAFTTAHALFREHRFDRPGVWLDFLSRTRHIGTVLAECHVVPNSFSVCTAPAFVLHRAYGDHWLAVGDAASAYDPISSQGIFKALTDGLLGGRAIAAHLAGDAQALRRHQAHLEARFEEHARQRAYFYDQERRFPDAPFWAERQTIPRWTQRRVA